MNRLSLHSISHKYSPTASEALSHGLYFKIFLGEHAPRPPYNTVHALYTWTRSRGLLSDVLQATNARKPGNVASARTDNCVLRAPHQTPLYMYTLLFFNLWIRPCIYGKCLPIQPGYLLVCIENVPIRKSIFLIGLLTTRRLYSRVARPHETLATRPSPSSCPSTTD